jgi:lysophospholipid acyltransferase (LPLAT)-like uncharacterized protein
VAMMIHIHIGTIQQCDDNVGMTIFARTHGRPVLPYLSVRFTSMSSSWCIKSWTRSVWPLACPHNSVTSW